MRIFGKLKYPCSEFNRFSVVCLTARTRIFRSR